MLFDLDGTLFDSTELLMTGYRYAVRACLGIETTEVDWEEHIGKPLRVQMAAFSSEKADEMVRTYRAWYAENHDRLIRCYPGVQEVLERLRGAGLKLGAVTSKKGYFARLGLKRFGLESLFGVVVGEEDVACHKPHPEPVEKTLRFLEAEPVAAVMVGDSCLDIESARAAGVISVGALWGPVARERLEASGPDFLLEDIRDLPSLLGV